jgi:hypothetical protein
MIFNDGENDCISQCVAVENRLNDAIAHYVTVKGEGNSNISHCATIKIRSNTIVFHCVATKAVQMIASYTAWRLKMGQMMVLRIEGRCHWNRSFLVSGLFYACPERRLRSSTCAFEEAGAGLVSIWGERPVYR